MVGMDSDNTSEKVDRAVEAMMSDREASADTTVTGVDTELEQVLRVASHLRFLPRAEFK
jgi:hypothetical protein